jgi:hypothetical protein
VASANGKRSNWRLVLHLPDDYAEDTAALFKWLRVWLIPAILHSPLKVTLELRVPEDVPPDQPSS